MHATYQLKPDELNENFLHAIKKLFKNQTIEIAISDVPAKEAANNELRKAGALKGRIKMSADFNAPLADFAEYQPSIGSDAQRQMRIERITTAFS